MRFTGSRWGRIAGWAALLLWPALLPRPANAVAGCIWYPVLGLSGLIYFLSRIQGDTAERHGPAPAGDSNPSASSASSSRQLASITSNAGRPWPESPDSHSWSRMDISTSSYQRPSCSTDSRRRPSSTNPAFW